MGDASFSKAGRAGAATGSRFLRNPFTESTDPGLKRGARRAIAAQGTTKPVVPPGADATDVLLREKSRAEIDKQMQETNGRYGAGLFGSFVRPAGRPQVKPRVGRVGRQ